MPSSGFRLSPAPTSILCGGRRRAVSGQRRPVAGMRAANVFPTTRRDTYRARARSASSVGSMRRRPFSPEAVERFPGDAGLAIGYAAAAHRRRDWEETVRRCETLRAALPLEPIGYTLAGAALRELGRYDEAEPLLASACARFR